MGRLVCAAYAVRLFIGAFSKPQDAAYSPQHTEVIIINESLLYSLSLSRQLVYYPPGLLLLSQQINSSRRER